MKVSVRELAEFVHRDGDLHYRRQSTTLAREGIDRQRAWQAGRGAGYQRERQVQAVFGDLTVSGRIDGWDEAERVVEEVKTTRADALALHADAGGHHLAQLRLYAAILALDDPRLSQLELRLIYLHPESPDEHVVRESWRRDDLIAFFDTTCAIYAAWIDQVGKRIDARNRALAALRFPYAEFHAHQRHLAKHIYRGFRDGVDWLVEAPTGTGKTMASVFPALKAVGEGELDRFLYLTARTTGQRAAEGALMDTGAPVTAVTLTAKERICFNPEAACDPERCAYAQGYYRRLPAARRELLDRGLASRQTVEAVARKHTVCPFELSVDAAAWADVVLCDYNYVFDPVVRLQRLSNGGLFKRVGLIVDEAHHLGERVRGMLGAAVSHATLRQALQEDASPAWLAKRLRSVDRALAALARELGEAPQREVAKPLALCRSVERLTAAADESPVDLAALPSVADALWQLWRFGCAVEWSEAEVRAEEGAEESAEENTEGRAESVFHYLASGTGTAFAIELVCTLPGRQIQRICEPFHGTVRQSGTLSPPDVFQRIHGLAEEGRSLQSAHGFDAERLGVYVVPDISTYYRDRARTLPALVRLIGDVSAALPGNCLVALPSFEYAFAVWAALASPAARCQRQDMDLDEREDFIRWLNEEAGRIGVVVMGGLFAESVDYDSRTLCGVVVVGPGLPPRSLRRDLLSEDAARQGVADDGDEIAYLQPAMTRVAQAVGRVARQKEARGIALLIDPRFGQASYQAFLPSRWRVNTVRTDRAAQAVTAFFSRC